MPFITIVGGPFGRKNAPFFLVHFNLLHPLETGNLKMRETLEVRYRYHASFSPKVCQI